MSIIYGSLIGINIGLSLALILSRWTWLEMRFNTGLIIMLGLFIGLLIGIWKAPLKRTSWGWVSIILVISIALLVGKGNPSSAITVTGALFREGILLPDLSLNSASKAIAMILLGTGLMSNLLKRI